MYSSFFFVNNCEYDILRLVEFKTTICEQREEKDFFFFDENSLPSDKRKGDNEEYGVHS